MPPLDDRGRDRRAAPSTATRSPNRRRVNRGGDVDDDEGGKGSVGGDGRATTAGDPPHRGRRPPLRQWAWAWAWARRVGLVRCALVAPLLFLGASWRKSLNLLARDGTGDPVGGDGDAAAFLPPRLPSASERKSGALGATATMTGGGAEASADGGRAIAPANITDPLSSAAGSALGGGVAVVAPSAAASDRVSGVDPGQGSEAKHLPAPGTPPRLRPPPRMVAYFPPVPNGTRWRSGVNASQVPMHFAVLPRVEVSPHEVRRREMLSRRWRYQLDREDRELSRSRLARGDGGHPPVDDASGCVPMATWQASGHRPTCNVLHETDLRGRVAADGRRGMERLGSGGWRVAWRMIDALEDVGEGGVHSPLGNDEARDYVLKTVKGKGGRFDAYAHRQHLVDAVIAERLTPSPHVVDVYGHCSQSVLNELAVGSLSRTVKARHAGLTSLDVLGFASEVAAGVADLHSIDYPAGDNATAVYKDLKPSNVVLSKEGRLKISDFNDAEVLLWNATADGAGQCGFRRKRWVPRYHSPEEVWQLPLTEKVDVYALGGIIYYVLVGKEPYVGMERRELFESVAKGIQPEIPRKYANSSDPIVSFLLETMGRCHRLNPHERPTAREVADELASRYALWKSKSELAK